MNGWISVNDRLPEEDYFENNDLIVSANENGENIVYADIYYKYGRFNTKCHTYGWLYKLDNVTHWMPLPEPPKDI